MRFYSSNTSSSHRKIYIFSLHDTVATKSIATLSFPHKRRVEMDQQVSAIWQFCTPSLGLLLMTIIANGVFQLPMLLVKQLTYKFNNKILIYQRNMLKSNKLLRHWQFPPFHYILVNIKLKMSQ